MKHLWEKTSTVVFADGGKCIRYICEDFPDVSVYSNTEYTPHANRSGGWFSHNYTVVTDDGFRKKFYALKDAKEFVENGGLENANWG